MKVLSCAAARRRLQAYHDDELPVGQQIAVDAHLETCQDCAAAIEELNVLRAALRASTPGRVALSAEEHASFHASVVNRAGAEQRLSFSTRLRTMFEDMHFVYAGLGAAGATVSCIAIMLSMMNFAALTNPGFNQNPVLVDARILMYAWPAAPNPMPSMLDQGFSGSAGADDGAFTLSAVVTREGRLVNLELHPEDGQQPKAGSSEARAVQTMLGAMSQARFEPARVGGLPIAVNMVWLVTHTTVRGTETPKALPVAPVAKKRRVELNVVPSTRKAVRA
jgi:hypothetical protein